MAEPPANLDGRYILATGKSIRLSLRVLFHFLPNIVTTYLNMFFLFFKLYCLVSG